MKKSNLVSAVIFFLFFIPYRVFTYEIEYLWQECEKNSEDIFSAKQNLDYCQTAKNTLRVLCPLSLDLSTGPNIYHNYEQISDEIELGSAAATLTQTLPGGAKLSVGASYGILSGYRSWNSAVGYTDKGYSDYFFVQIQYSQSLNPYWIHGVSVNPSKRQVSLAVASEECNLMQITKNSYSKVLSYYVRSRRNKRDILLAEKQTDLLKSNLDSVRQMRILNSASLSDEWQAEKSLSDAESSLNSYKLEYKEILNSLHELCGYDIEVSENADFPIPPMKLFDTDPFLNNLQVQLQLLDSHFLIDLQNSAAVISFTGRFKDSSKMKDDIGLDFYDDSNHLYWGATISGKINNLYGGEGKLYRKKYEIEHAKYEKQIDKYIKKTALEKAYLESLILSYEENIANATLNMSNEKENFNGMKQLYENGQKRQIDVLSAEIEYLKQKFALENLKDILWQTKWLRIQFSD